MPETHAGLAEYSILYKGTIFVALGALDCNGKYIQLTKSSIESITMHEIGHILGADHVLDESHLMYSDEPPFTTDNFESFSYVFPNNTNTYFVGWSELESEYESFSPSLDKLSNHIELLESEYYTLEKRYDLYPEIIHDNNQYNKAMKLYDDLQSKALELNDVANQYNSIADSQNEIVEQMNCYPNVSDENCEMYMGYKICKIEPNVVLKRCITDPNGDSICEILDS